MAEYDRPTPKNISLQFISQRLGDVLDQMQMINDEIAEMKEQDGKENSNS